MVDTDEQNRQHVGRDRGSLRKSIVEMEDSLNDMHQVSVPFKVDTSNNSMNYILMIGSSW